MHPGPGLRVREWLRAVPGWPVWQHPRWLVAYILTVTGGYLVAIGVTGVLAPVPVHDLALFGGLLLPPWSSMRWGMALAWRPSRPCVARGGCWP